MIIAEADIPEGRVEVKRNPDFTYTVCVEGVDRHPSIDAEAAICALAHYLHSTNHKLSKLTNQDHDQGSKILP